MTTEAEKLHERAAILRKAADLLYRVKPKTYDESGEIHAVRKALRREAGTMIRRARRAAALLGLLVALAACGDNMDPAPAPDAGVIPTVDAQPDAAPDAAEPVCWMTRTFTCPDQPTWVYQLCIPENGCSEHVWCNDGHYYWFCGPGAQP